MGSTAANAGVAFSLFCEKCGHDLKKPAAEPMQLVGLFKPSLVTAIIPSTHAREIRWRCRHCGFVNVFHPADLTESWRDNIVIK